ncbi:hypothetical protein KF840_15685 [bacterium]|nr:hypothetical protein [bacterium]
MRGYRTLRRLLLVGLLAAPGIGCGTMHLVAPPGREVYIMPADKPAQVHVERTVWFYQWGAKAFSDSNSTRQDIERYHLREVRFDTYQKWFEMLMNPVMSIVSIQRRTVIVEGNP